MSQFLTKSHLEYPKQRNKRKGEINLHTRTSHWIFCWIFIKHTAVEIKPINQLIFIECLLGTQNQRKYKMTETDISNIT